MGKVLEAGDKLIADAKESWADHRIQADELKQLYVDALKLAVALKDEPDAENDAAIVLDRLYDAVIAPIDIKGVPEIAERWIDSGIKTAGRAFLAELFRQAKT